MEKDRISHIGQKRNYLMVTLTIVLLASFSLNGFFIIKHRDYVVLGDRYLDLLSVNNMTQSYYYELTDQYNKLKSEYVMLDNLYSKLLRTENELNQELDSIRNFGKNRTLVENKTIILGSKNNYSQAFDILYSGYVELNYSASGDSYVWIGSTSIDEVYYSRNPPFPEVARENSVIVPVIPDLVIHFSNPSETDEITLTFSLIYIY